MDENWRKLAQETWPAVEIVQAGGFVVRNNYAHGGSRANSAELFRDDYDIDINIPRYIIWPSDHELADRLRSMGYIENDHATVFQVAVSNHIKDSHCKITDHVDERLEAFFINHNIDKARVDIMRRSKLNKVFVTYEVDGEIIGAINGGFEDDRAWVYSLIVRKQYRRRGISRKIMQSIFYVLAMNGVREVALSVLPSNHVAIKLYTSLGFIQTSQYYFLERSDG